MQQIEGMDGITIPLLEWASVTIHCVWYKMRNVKSHIRMKVVDSGYQHFMCLAFCDLIGTLDLYQTRDEGPPVFTLTGWYVINIKLTFLAYSRQTWRDWTGILFLSAKNISKKSIFCLGEIRLDIPDLNLDGEVAELAKNKELVDRIKQVSGNWQQQIATAIDQQLKKKPQVFNMLFPTICAR